MHSAPKYVLLQWNYEIGHFQLGTTNVTLFARWGPGATSIALHAGALHTFKPGEKELHQAWTFRTGSGLGRASCLLGDATTGA